MTEVTIPKPEVDIIKAEKQRLLTVLLKNKDKMVSDYKNTIKQTGGLLTTSMTYAYDRGLRDAFKLLSKENE